MNRYGLMSQELSGLLEEAMVECGWGETDVRRLLEPNSLKNILQLLRGEGYFLPKCGPGPVSLAPMRPLANETDGRREIENPHYLSVEDALGRLRQANEEEGWGIGESAVAALAESAPEWPDGRLAFRSLRIRWGSGNAGVAGTFERHAARIERIFDPKPLRWEHLRSDTDRLRLLAGNDAHRPAVEWVLTDLGENRERKSVEAVRGPSSLADEGLALAWLFPEYVRSIDYGDSPALFLAGYELNVPGHDARPWQHVPIVYRYVSFGEVLLGAYWCSDVGSGCSVPASRKCRR